MTSGRSWATTLTHNYMRSCGVSPPGCKTLARWAVAVAKPRRSTTADRLLGGLFHPTALQLIHLFGRLRVACTTWDFLAKRTRLTMRARQWASTLLGRRAMLFCGAKYWAGKILDLWMEPPASRST